MSERTYTVQAVVTAFRVLEALRSRPMGCTEIAEALGIHKNLAFRHGETLADIGLVDRLADQTYALAPRESEVTPVLHAAQRAYHELARVLDGR